MLVFPFTLPYIILHSDVSNLIMCSRAWKHIDMIGVWSNLVVKSDVNRLRSRNENIGVEHIPIHCPTG